MSCFTSLTEPSGLSYVIFCFYLFLENRLKSVDFSEFCGIMGLESSFSESVARVSPIAGSVLELSSVITFNSSLFEFSLKYSA